MDFEINKPSKVKGFFKTLFLTLLLSGCIFAALYFTNVITFKQENNCEVEEDNTENKEEKIDMFKTSNEEIESIFQKKYEKMFDELQEGNSYTTSITENIVYNGMNIIGYKVDLVKIYDYFTDDCLNYIKKNFYYSNDGINYYLLPNTYGFLNMKNTIFGKTKRTLKVQMYDDDKVIFKTNTDNINEYIMYKKVNDNWKVELFN